MSEASGGPGWWQASDGRWYGPDEISADDEPEEGPPVVPAAPAAAGGPSGPGVPPPGWGYPPGTVHPAYAPGAPVYGYATGSKTNGLAIASLICSLFFWLYGLPAILAIVFGFVARGQIRRSNGTQGGNGMAVAGIIIGFAGLAVGVLLVVLLRGYVLRHCNHQLTHCDFTTNGS